MGKITKKNIAKFTKEEWLAERKKGVGGSDVGAILGLNKYRSPLSVWMEKTGRVDNSNIDNEAMLQGRMIEDVVAQRFADVSGKKVQKSNFMFGNTDYPHAQINVDRLIKGEKSILECKTVNAFGGKNYTSDSFNPSYYAQCVYYMAVMEYERIYLSVMVLGVDFKTYLITRNKDDVFPEWCESLTFVDDEEIKTMMEAVNDFWEYVHNDEQPPTIGVPADASAVSALYPNATGEETSLVGYDSIIDKAQALSEQIAVLKDELEGVQASIKAQLGTASTGLSDRYTVTWKQQDKKSFDKKALLKDHPEIKEETYTKTSSYRVLRIKQNKA